MIRVLLILVLTSVPAFAETKPIIKPWQPSLVPADWQLRYSPTMPGRPLQDGAALAFDFPALDPARMPCKDHLSKKCPAVHYLVGRAKGPLTGAQSITLTVEIITTGNPAFQWNTEKHNVGCGTPAHVRVMLWKKGAGLSDSFGRWWATVNGAALNAILLQPGRYSVTVPLTRENFLPVYGNAMSKKSYQKFAETLFKLGNVAMTFGGGCYYGHGVNVWGGTARFRLIEYTINW